MRFRVEAETMMRARVKRARSKAVSMYVEGKVKEHTILDHNDERTYTHDDPVSAVAPHAPVRATGTDALARHAHTHQTRLPNGQPNTAIELPSFARRRVLTVCSRALDGNPQSSVGHHRGVQAFRIRRLQPKHQPRRCVICLVASPRAAFSRNAAASHRPIDPRRACR